MNRDERFDDPGLALTRPTIVLLLSIVGPPLLVALLLVIGVVWWGFA